MDARHEALLILGPTGSGKSPLGDYLARHGWNGRRCRHLDFGVSLREVGRGRARGFTSDEVAFVRNVLATGALRRVDAPLVTVVLERLFLAKAFDDRTEEEVSDFFEMLARVGDAEVARVLATHAVPRGVLGRLRRLTPLQRLSLGSLRRMRSPEARDVADEVRESAPRAVRDILDDRFGDL